MKINRKTQLSKLDNELFNEQKLTDSQKKGLKGGLDEDIFPDHDHPTFSNPDGPVVVTEDG